MYVWNIAEIPVFKSYYPIWRHEAYPWYYSVGPIFIIAIVIILDELVCDHSQCTAEPDTTYISVIPYSVIVGTPTMLPS